MSPKFYLPLVFVVLFSTTLITCKKKSSSTTNDVTSSTTTETTDTSSTSKTDPVSTVGKLALSGFNGILPPNLAVASVSETLSTEAIAAGSLVITAKSLTAPPATPANQAQSNDFYSKIQRLQSTMTTTTLKECMAAIPSEFNLQQGELASGRPCWGGTFTTAASVHPDFGPAGGAVSAGGGGTNGIQADYDTLTATSGMACSVAVTNQLMGVAGDYADTALGLEAMVACAARIAEKSLPEAGAAPMDLTDALSGLDMTSANFNVSSATIEKNENTSGNPTFITRLEGWIKDVPRDLQRNFTLVVRHKQTEAENASYHGVFQFVIKEFDNVSAKDMAASLVYSWENDTLNYRYRQVNPPSTTTEIFDSSTYEIIDRLADPSVQEIVAETDDKGFGKMAAVIKNNTELVINMMTKEDGTGAAYVGHRDGSAALGSADFYKIAGLRCLNGSTPPQASGIYSDYVQKQGIAANSSTGIWDLVDTESYFRFVPRLSCYCGSDSIDTSYTAWDFAFERSENAGTTNFSCNGEVSPSGHTVKLYSKTSYLTEWDSGPSIPTF